MDNITKVKYRQFVNSDSYSLFKFVIDNEINDIIDLIVNCTDKEELWKYKQHLDALKKFQVNIMNKINEEN